jgi:4-hydroxy-2-oxoheptanedioate aldolase
MRSNRVKHVLAEGQASLGSWIVIGDTLSAEFMAHMGLDWLVVDMEHGFFGLETALGLIQAVSTTETIPLVRVAANDSTLIKHALDLGAYGVVVPMVNTESDAQAAVTAAKYPLVGRRSVGATRPVLYAGSDYVQHANTEILTIVQIEHATAVHNADEILSVEGVDCCFVGPNDLAASLGVPPSLEVTSTVVEEAVQSVLIAAHRNRVAAGIHVATARDARFRIDQGFQFVALGSDLGFLLDGGRAAVHDAMGRAKDRTLIDSAAVPAV